MSTAVVIALGPYRSQFTMWSLKPYKLPKYGPVIMLVFGFNSLLLKVFASDSPKL